LYEDLSLKHVTKFEDEFTGSLASSHINGVVKFAYEPNGAGFAVKSGAVDLKGWS
jgi:hypothetical protein